MLGIGCLESEVGIRHCLEMAGCFPRNITSVIAQLGFRRGRACFYAVPQIGGELRQLALRYRPTTTAFICV